MKTKLISRLTLMSLLLSAAVVSGTALADESGYHSRSAGTEQSHFNGGSLHHTAYHHHHRRHHRHHRHPR